MSFHLKHHASPASPILGFWKSTSTIIASSTWEASLTTNAWLANGAQGLVALDFFWLKKWAFMTFQWCLKLQVVGDKKSNHIRRFYVHFYSLAQLPMHCYKTVLLFPLNASPLQGVYQVHSIFNSSSGIQTSLIIPHHFSPFSIFNSSFHPPFSPVYKKLFAKKKKKTPKNTQKPPPESLARPVESFWPIAAGAPGFPDG